METDKTTTRVDEPEDIDDRPVIEEDQPELIAEVEPEKNGKASIVEKQAQDAAANVLKEEEKQRLEDIEKARKDLEALDPETGAVRWIIGKPPEHGGKEKQYAIYVQEKLPWMPRQKFFGLVAKTLAESVRAGGGSIGSMADIFNDDSGGSFVERGKQWSQRDFGDLGSFITTLFELVGYSPEFMLEAYCIWLNVPRVEREWAKDKFAQDWRPEDGKWGLKEEDHDKIVNTFIDQNYEEIRHFLMERLPAIIKRIALHEKSKPRQTNTPDLQLAQ